MKTQYNRQTRNRMFSLTERGFHQAERNNSHQIWTLLSWKEQNDCQTCTKNNEQNETFETTNDPTKFSNQENVNQTKKNVSFKLSKNQELSVNKDDDVQPEIIKKAPQERRNKFVKSNIKQKQTIKQKPIQTEFQKLKKKSIQKYIKDQIPYSRTMSNTAFRKFYQRPCPQAYGNKSTNQGGVCYGDFMKTHNIQPHTLDNKPVTYQTYTSALNYGKRTKLDLQDRWKRIERQLAKNLDYRQLNYMKAIGEISMNEQDKIDILKQNINQFGKQKGTLYPQQFKKQSALTLQTTKSLGKLNTTTTLKIKDNDVQLQENEKKRSKSSEKPLYFIYKYKEEDQNYSCTRYARDRHGITCYVDNCFRQNDEAFLNFQKKIKPIYAEKCKPQDINIDNIRIKNSQKNKKQQFSRHYLLPNVEIPYVPQNYSRKKSQSIAQTTI